ncbi:MAG: carotenoid oxygenase family protein [Fibrella sp.]|nr:carotenoid oxygenase family protein [Armatimonadota bacterium]
MHNQFKGGLQTQNKEIVVEELSVEGQIPPWLVGSLIRTTPAQFEVGGQSYRHWFDGLAMLHSFAFQEGRVSYRNRFLESKTYCESNQSGKIAYAEFATDPCQTLFKRLKTAFRPEIGGNDNVNVSRFGDDYVALTEVPLAMTFDSQTLDTLGVYDYEKTDAQISTAHPHFDSSSGLGITYAAKLGMSNEYRFYTMNGGKLDLLAAIPTKSVSYIHSFGITEHYLLLAEYALKLTSALSMLVSGKPFIENFEWLPDEGARFIVVDKSTGAVVSESQTEAFFAFHHVNAFERDGEIFADFVAYADARLVEQYYLDKLRADDAHVSGGELRRYRIPLTGGRATFELLSDTKIEFPRLNYERFNGQPYAYLYGASLKSGTTDFYNELSKIEVDSGVVKTWQEADCYPGEPVFIAAPGAGAEDAGAILSVVFDSRRGTTFLVVLNAQSFTEIARTRLPQHIPFGFHGQFFQSVPTKT